MANGAPTNALGRGRPVASRPTLEPPPPSGPWPSTPSACHGVDCEHRELDETEGRGDDADDEGRSAEDAGQQRGEACQVGSKGWIRP
jgi:hypothetical protein